MTTAKASTYESEYRVFAFKHYAIMWYALHFIFVTKNNLHVSYLK